MKSTKLKMLLTAAGFFALSATFAQDTTTMPKMDTSKMPMKDTTKMPGHDSTSMSSAKASSNTVAVAVTETTVAFVSEAKATKEMKKANPAKLPEDNQ